jgi:hypothetical protein
MNNYKPLNKISNGSFGNIYRCRELSTGQEVAIKVMITDYNHGIQSTTIREIVHLKKLKSCNNIVKLRKIINDKNKVYFVMELYQHDLLYLVHQKNKNLRLSQVKSIIHQILVGLNECHQNGIVHYDLKPANVLYNENGKVYLCDFGQSEKHIGKNIMGLSTPLYAPLELLLKDHTRGDKADIWAVGCIFAEIIHGEPIFVSNSMQGIINRIKSIVGKSMYYGRKDLASIIGYCDRDGLDLLEKMLDTDPKTRITVQDALNHPFFSGHRSHHLQTAAMRGDTVIHNHQSRYKTQIDDVARMKLVSFMIVLSNKFRVMDRTIVLAIYYLDMILNCHNIKKPDLYCLVSVCFWIAYKYVEIRDVHVRTFAMMIPIKMTEQRILDMEVKVLFLLDWNLDLRIPLDYGKKRATNKAMIGLLVKFFLQKPEYQKYSGQDIYEVCYHTYQVLRHRDINKSGKYKKFCQYLLGEILKAYTDTNYSRSLCTILMKKYSHNDIEKLLEKRGLAPSKVPRRLSSISRNPSGTPQYQRQYQQPQYQRQYQQPQYINRFPAINVY